MSLPTVRRLVLPSAGQSKNLLISVLLLISITTAAALVKAKQVGLTPITKPPLAATSLPQVNQASQSASTQASAQTILPSGAQLFQSPAALAAAAAAAASSNQLQVQSSPFLGQPQQAGNNIAANLISPAPGQLQANSLVSARVDTNELLKQAVQQANGQQQQQSAQMSNSYNIEQGKLLA